MRQDGMRDLTMQMHKKDGGIIPLQLRQAVVTAITGDTLTVTLDGTSITGVRKLASYSPTVNDTVWLFQNGGDLLAIDRTGASAYAVTAHKHDTLKAATQAQFNMVPPNGSTAGANHSGTTWNGTHFRWAGRLLLIATGRGAHWSVDGYYSLTMPADGTVITGYGGAANQTVVAAGIPIGPHVALYAFPTVGGNNSQYTYGLVSYTATYTLPENAVFIAGMTENANSSLLRTGWGQTLDYWRTPTFTNGWQNYAGYQPAGYMKDSDGFVHLRGLVSSGTIGSGTPMFYLPSGYWPYNTGKTTSWHFAVASNAAFGWGGVGSDGRVFLGGGSNVWVDLGGVAPFRAEA